MINDRDTEILIRSINSAKIKEKRYNNAQEIRHNA
jgi:hypothetical protein